MTLRLTTLGTLRIERDGSTLDRLLAARNRCALLVHLAVEREVTRDAATGMLWPDRPPTRARHLLSQTLYELRQELGEEWLETAGEHLRVTEAVQVDLHTLETAVEAGDFDRAVEVYGGPFLPGSAMAVSRPMEGWIDAIESRAVRLHRKARRGAIDARVESGHLPEALALAREWVEIDPLDDEAQHRLIELLAATGDRSGALRQYEEHARLVETELELEPMEETRDLVERIREGDLGPRTAERVPERASEPGEDPAAAGAPAGEGGPLTDQRRSPAPEGPEAGGPEAGDLVERIASLRHLRTAKWTLGYLAGAIIVLQALALLSETRGLPGGYLRVTALALAAGAIVVLAASWYLEERGRRFGTAEVALTFLVAVFLMSVPAWFNRASSVEAGETYLDPNRIAVLYFDDMSSDGSLGHLAEGFTEALIRELSQVDGLDVVSRRAVAPFQANKQVGYDSIVSTLKAGLLVEGSLSRIRDRLRLTIQLVDGETASQVMSGILESPADSADRLLLAMPEEAARLLRHRLGDWVRLQEMRSAATSVRAVELVQRAEPMVDDARQLGRSDLDASLPLLDRADSLLAEAERLSPEWPEPTLMRADVAEVRSLTVSDVPSQYDPEVIQIAFDHLDRVLEQHPGHAVALARRGNLKWDLAENAVGGEEEIIRFYEQAEADLRRAVVEDENLAEAWWGLSRYLYTNNQYAEALRSAVRAMEADAYLTADIQTLWYLFLVTFNAEDHAAAQDWCDEIVERRLGQSHAAFCRLYLLTSSPLVPPDVDRGWEAAETILSLARESQRDVYRTITALHVARVIIRAGMPDSARAVLDRVVPEPVPDWAVYDAAHVHLLLGDEDRALDLLDRWFEWNPVRAKRLARDWWFRRLHGHPRFEALVGGVGDR